MSETANDLAPENQERLPLALIVPAAKAAETDIVPPDDATDVVSIHPPCQIHSSGFWAWSEPTDSSDPSRNASAG